MVCVMSVCGPESAGVSKPASIRLFASSINTLCMLNDMKQIDNRIDLNLLTVFEALHEEGGATRAAVRLGLTQSAVSAALQRLRTMYGDPLFTRTGRGLAPTVRAQELRPVIGAALDSCRESLAMGKSTASRYEGRSVVIGMSDDFEIASGRALIDAVALRAPGLRLAFRQTHSRIVADMLMSREIDLAIASGGFATQWLGHESLAEGDYGCVVEPASMPSARGRFDHAFRCIAVPHSRHRCRRDDAGACGTRHRRRHGPALAALPAAASALSHRTRLAHRHLARRRHCRGEDGGHGSADGDALAA